MAKLSDDEIREKLSTLPEWKYDAGSLVREYTFADFAAGFAFVVRLALLAEKANHHPDIDIRYNKVHLALVTHDAGGLTAKDFDLAAQADKFGPA